MDVCFAPEGGNSFDDQVRFGPGPLALEGCNSHEEHLCFALEGGNSRDDQGRFALGPLALEGGNSHDKQVRFAPEGGQPVEHFGELDLGLVQSLRDPTGQECWGVVTDCSA